MQVAKLSAEGNEFLLGLTHRNAESREPNHEYERVALLFSIREVESVSRTRGLRIEVGQG